MVKQIYVDDIIIYWEKRLKQLNKGHQLKNKF